MAAIKTPDVGIPANPPVVTKEWLPGSGETISHEWPLGTTGDISENYETLKAAAQAGNNTQSLQYRSANGRASLIARFGRSGNTNEGYGDDVTIVEELYAIDVIKDLAEAPYFASTLGSTHPLYSKQNGKGAPLTDDEVAWINDCVETCRTEAEITTDAPSSSLQWTNWDALMKEYRYHKLRGGTYYETAFVLRRSLYGVRTSQIKASFTNINTVVTAPTFKSQMDMLIDALPSGEWLYKPPQAEHLGRGKWRITQEWQWAEKWAIYLGGSLNIP